MNAPNILNQDIQIPQLTLNPLSWWGWWTTPRTKEDDLQFYERNIRVAILLLTGFIVAFTLLDFVGGWTDLINFIFQFAFVVIATLFLEKGKIRIAAWVLTAYLLAGVSTVSFAGYWTPASTIAMHIIIIMSALILSSWRSIMIATLIVLSSYSYITLTMTQESPLASTDVFSQPLTAVIAFNLLTLIIVVLGYYLINAFRKQSTARRELVQTLEKRVEERTHDLNIAKQQAESAQREAEKANEVKSQFLANMSHELRTPLNAILNFTAFVADGVMGPVNDEQVDLLNQSISSGKHLLALINDVLDITKIEAGLMDMFVQDVDMKEVLGSVASVGKGLVKDKQVRFIADIDTDLPISFGDKRRMRQVFLNMVSNAVKFTNEGEVILRARAIENGIRVDVQDTGIGIPEQDHHLIFESFKQAKHDFSETIGTGLGMPISKYFVELHQGNMWFESIEGKGSTFYVELPILTEEQANNITPGLQEQV